MTDSDSARLSRELTDEIARLAQIPTEDIHADAHLIADLCLDSLALVELVVYLVEKYDAESLLSLDDREWTAVTVESLFTECTRGQSVAQSWTERVAGGTLPLPPQ